MPVAIIAHAIHTGHVHECGHRVYHSKELWPYTAAPRNSRNPDVLFAETLARRKGGLIKAQGRFYGWISSIEMPNLLTIDINCVPWTIKFGCGPSFLPPSQKAYKIDVRKQLALWVQFSFSFSNIIVRIYSPPFFFPSVLKPKWICVVQYDLSAIESNHGIEEIRVKKME